MTRDRRFVVCVRNTGYAASLEQNKIYVAIPDEDAEKISTVGDAVKYLTGKVK